MEKKEVPFEYYDGKLGVKTKFLISDRNKHKKSLRLISYNTLFYRIKSKTRSEKELRRASLGFEALVIYDSLCEDWRSQLVEKFGKPPEQVRQSFFEKYYIRDNQALDFYLAHRYGDDNSKRLTPELIERYTINASVLNTLLEVRANRKSYAKAIGVVGQFDIWDSLSRDVNAFHSVDHDLPTNKDALRRKVGKYQKEGYSSLISGKLMTRNAAIIKEDRQDALLEELLAQANNLNNEQVARNFNIVANQLKWRKIDASIVARKRKEVELFTKSLTRGATELMHTKLMQFKRSRPSAPMLFWVHDGWDAELLYQKTEINKKGDKVTTYHHRATVVMIIDPYNDYIVGYAIGESETPDLIRKAYKNAINHTQELFDSRFQPYQIQSDNYQIKHLKPFYESLCKHFTPAAVKNSKSKVIEPFFDKFNEKHFQEKMIPNWSGHNVTASKDNQPNGDYLSKIRHQFPDYVGVQKQIIQAIENDRAEKRLQYVENFANVQEKHLLPMSFNKYMHVFGETTGYTNRMEGDGLEVTILGTKHWYDCFDLNWRKYMHLDWLVRFDRDDLSQVVVTNAKSRNGRLVEEIGDVSFVLQETYIQPMAIADKQDGDGEQRALVHEYNKGIKTAIVDRMIERKSTIQDLFDHNPELEMLQKFLIPDSMGQHKDHKSEERRKAAQKKLQQFEQQDEKRQLKDWQKEQEAYLNAKVDLSNYLND
ncbi:hypothetical protein HX096_12860 [Empedobacter falsenii]|uniref:hypothetical protein n=1 Tax=Empedobacter falsenii TaxID=343874 RepID=UPI002577C0E6|nr:hypothetical protein [Empedobacter falsenii]MDM1548744.1 hypothetical protein [Empedobacter falsenii]